MFTDRNIKTGFYKRNIVLGDLIAFLNNGSAADVIWLDLLLDDIKH